jgi:small basic protein
MTEVSIEAVPVLTGVLIGLATWRLVPQRFRALVAVCLSAPAGALITYAAGELELSWAFVVFDIGQVVLAALLTGLAVQKRVLRIRERAS